MVGRFKFFCYFIRHQLDDNSVKTIFMLKTGDIAPYFSTTDEKGNLISLNDLSGKKVVLYFYPKDNTPGCTNQACNLRDNYKELLNRGFVVLGVSADSQRKHQNFVNKFKLPFPLLMDLDKKIINDYEAWGWKKFMGLEFEGILRKTYVIDENGKIEDIIEKVKTKEHSAQILKD